MSNKVNDILSSLRENSSREKKEEKEEVKEMTAYFRGKETTEYKQGMDDLKYRIEDNLGDIVNKIYSEGGFGEQEVYQGDVVTVIFSYLASEVENLKYDKNALREIIDMLEDYTDRR